MDKLAQNFPPVLKGNFNQLNYSIMKNLVLCLGLLLCGTFAQAQIIELEEAKIDYFPNLERGVENSYSYMVMERTPGEFSADALGFMKRHFDINAFIDEIGDVDYKTYELTFKNSQGYLKAEFDDKGNLKQTRQEFNDVLVPANIRTELYKNHKGWTMVKNKYSAKGSGDIIKSEVYKIKLQNGNKNQTIKIDPRTLGTGVVVSE